MKNYFFSTLLIAIVFAVSFIGTGCSWENPAQATTVNANAHKQIGGGLGSRTTIITNGYESNDSISLAVARAAESVVQKAGFTDGLASTQDFDMTIQLTYNDAGTPAESEDDFGQISISLTNTKDELPGMLATGKCDINKGGCWIEGIKAMEPDIQEQLKPIVAAMKARDKTPASNSKK